MLRNFKDPPNSVANPSCWHSMSPRAPTSTTPSGMWEPSSRTKCHRIHRLWISSFVRKTTRLLQRSSLKRRHFTRLAGPQGFCRANPACVTRATRWEPPIAATLRGIGAGNCEWEESPQRTMLSTRRSRSCALFQQLQHNVWKTRRSRRGIQAIRHVACHEALARCHFIRLV